MNPVRERQNALLVAASIVFAALVVVAGLIYVHYLK